MKHRVKMDVVTEKKGFFGSKQVVERKTVTVSGREYRRIRDAKRKAAKQAKVVGGKLILPLDLVGTFLHRVVIGYLGDHLDSVATKYAKKR